VSAGRTAALVGSGRRSVPTEQHLSVRTGAAAACTAGRGGSAYGGGPGRGRAGGSQRAAPAGRAGRCGADGWSGGAAVVPRPGRA